MKTIKKNFFRQFSLSISVQDMCDRIHWLIFLRWFAGFGVVISLLVGKAFFELESVTLPLMLGICILCYNLLFELLRRYMARRLNEELTQEAISRRVAVINVLIFMDLVVLAALIYFTGGITNPFLFFFIFHMVISSILLSRVNAFLWAFFTIAMVSILFYLEHNHIIPSHEFFPFYPQGLVDNKYYALMLLLSFAATMIITVYFATAIMRPIRKHQMELLDLKNSLKKQKEKLEIKNLELEELDSSKTQFLYRVEHELKAPIGALSSLLSVVIRGYTSVSEEKKKDFLNRAFNRVGVMKELVTDLLSLSRINERSFKLEKQSLNLLEIIEHTISDLERYAEKNKIEVNSELDPLIPPILADRSAILEIVQNLVQNGIKYTIEGGKVNLGLSREGDFVKFMVEDTGIGISEEDLGRIFEEFFRTSNAKAFEEGSGLGLSLVKRMVEQHGGTIELASKLNVGTTFTVRLPLQNVEHKE